MLTPDIVSDTPTCPSSPTSLSVRPDARHTQLVSVTCVPSYNPAASAPRMHRQRDGSFCTFGGRCLHDAPRRQRGAVSLSSHAVHLFRCARSPAALSSIEMCQAPRRDAASAHARDAASARARASRARTPAHRPAYRCKPKPTSPADTTVQAQAQASHRGRSPERIHVSACLEAGDSSQAARKAQVRATTHRDPRGLRDIAQHKVRAVPQPWVARIWTKSGRS